MLETNIKTLEADRKESKNLSQDDIFLEVRFWTEI